MGVSLAAQARSIKNCPALAGRLASGHCTDRQRISPATVLWRTTVTLQLVAFTLDILLHSHAFIISSFIKGNAGLLFVSQQDAAAGVDHSAVAVVHILGNIGSFAALCAVAGDQEEGLGVSSADGSCFLGMGAADDQTDAGLARFADVIPAQLAQAVAH